MKESGDRGREKGEKRAEWEEKRPTLTYLPGCLAGRTLPCLTSPYLCTYMYISNAG